MFIIKNIVENSFCCICSLNLFGILIVRLYHYIYLIKLLMNSLFCSGNETRTRVNGLWSSRGQIRTGDLKLMKLVSYHCSTLRYICVLNFQVLFFIIKIIYIKPIAGTTSSLSRDIRNGLLYYILYFINYIVCRTVP